MKKFIIITTINEKTKAIIEFEKFKNWQLVIVGDKKSRSIKNSSNLIFLSIEDQAKLRFKCVGHLPFNHYTRKNIGYLFAFKEGADIIYDTDDDNIPYSHWGINNFTCSNCIESDDDFVNIYKYFTTENIWPRGFPINQIKQQGQIRATDGKPHKIGVWQGLADIDPDVDAIYRLIFNNPVTFERKEPVVLPINKYCPFNSQNTTWASAVFPYLYLPATVSFRFTDILRGFIAQRLMWHSGQHLGVHEATVFQKRNFHDNMKDFRDEVECYLSTTPVINVLNSLVFSDDPLHNLYLAYQALHTAGLVSLKEQEIVRAWVSDVEKFMR